MGGILIDRHASFIWLRPKICTLLWVPKPYQFRYIKNEELFVLGKNFVINIL